MRSSGRVDHFGPASFRFIRPSQPSSRPVRRSCREPKVRVGIFTPLVASVTKRSNFQLSSQSGISVLSAGTRRDGNDDNEGLRILSTTSSEIWQGRSTVADPHSYVPPICPTDPHSYVPWG